MKNDEIMESDPIILSKKKNMDIQNDNDALQRSLPIILLIKGNEVLAALVEVQVQVHSKQFQIVFHLSIHGYIYYLIN